MQPEIARQLGSAPRVKAQGRLTTGAKPLDEAASKVGAVRIEPMLPPAEKFAEQRAKYGLDRWYKVIFDETIESETARKIFAGTPGIEKAEKVVPMSLQEGNGGFVKANGTPAKAPGISYPFSDPQLPAQWHYRNFGNLGGSVEGADINLFDAWKISTGRPEVVVAIIDGGVDYRHEDLAANMYVNQAELNGTDGVDDDGNGYVDDIYGYNFCTNTGEIYPHSHGTHVAGTVAAVNNNSIGVAGVAGGDGTPGTGVRLLSCQVFDSRAGAGEGDFAQAIVYAAESGATIAQCSWGWDAPGYYEQAVLDAIDYFTETARSTTMTGGLCIFAGGNNGETGDYYPAAYDKVLAVAAMTNELRPASYSNNGPWVDVTAPGGLLDYGEANGVLSTLPNNEYGYNEGTSMATPHVSGIAALVLSKHGSPTFVNSSLRTQLETSVNDFYGFADNEQYRGNFGSGHIDAAKALQLGDGSAPSPVEDFSLAAAQDYIIVDWVIPASSDNNVHHHIIYYSESPFTASSDLGSLSSSVADTKFLSSGESVSHEIGGLKAMTTYYVAILPVNRWGKPSTLSPVKSIQTNAGPQMTLDVTDLSMTSTANSPLASTQFTIGNDADGILKWESSKRTVSVWPASVTRPNIGRTAPYSGKIGATKAPERSGSAVTDEYLTEDYPKSIQYYEYLYATIGDSDNTLPNSMAQWFRVDPEQFPEGFNLTDVTFEGNYGRNPIIQIYRGNTSLSSASLLQTVNYNFFSYGFPVTLNEQLYFAPGESFWVVAHFEGGQEGYPLGMCQANTTGIASYSFMSNDMGKTWTQLSSALAGSRYESVADNMTWGIRARSANPDWSSVIELAPSSGTLRKGETSEVKVSADGSKLINGTYNMSVRISTNEDSDSEHAVPLSYTVEGNKPSVQTPKIVNFGSLLVGQSKTLTVEVFNSGYGNFAGSQWGPGIYEDNIQSTSEHFAGPEYIQSGFPARSKVQFDITYKPESAGSHTGNIIFTDVNGEQVRIVVQGAATDPSKLTIEPATVDAGTLTLGEDPVQVSFKIGNEGKYPLEYVFPKFSDETIEGATSKNHKFGYTVMSTLDGYTPFAYDGNPAMVGGTDITATFSDNEYVSAPISLGFAFPYYGNYYEKAYITTFGGIMFAPNESTFRSPLTPESYGVPGTGLISAYGSQLMTGPDTKIEYAKVDGKFMVKFTNVLALVYDKEYTPVSFHMALSRNGDIEIFYDEYEPMNVFQEGYGLFCGINDFECADVVTVTSAEQADYWGSEEPTADNQRFRSFCSGTAVKFEAPKPSFVRSVNVPYGIVNPGESVEITATVSADETMYAGPTFNKLAIATNDPNPEHTYVYFEAVIAGDELVPVAELEDSDIDFGSVFRTADILIPVTVKNSGRDAMTVESISFEKGLLSTAMEVPFTLGAGMAKDIMVKVPTENEGAVSDVMEVVTSAGTLKADIKGTVIGCPEISLSFTSVEETVESGTPLVKELTVENKGNETLTYSITPDPIVRLGLPENKDSKTSYIYSSSVDDSSVKFDWVDIETNGLGEQHTMTYYNLHDFVAVDLPFEFPFYGKKYSKMFIYNTGFVSFTERRDDRLWPEPPAEFPEGTVYTNLIAPYWGLHSMDQTKTAGTFHYVTDDRAVISFMEYGNSMNIGVCFQLIMEKDGSFKFQYKGFDENASIFNIYGVAGISNEDATASVKLAERLVAFGNAVEFKPVVEASIEAGQKETVSLDFDTKRMAGQFDTALKLNTNVPGSEKMEIPVSLTITGEAKPVWPGKLAIENVIGYQSTDYSNPMVQMGAMYDIQFSLVNEGTAPFEITDILNGGPTEIDEWFGDEYPLFQLFVYGEETDMWTGEPTGMKQWMNYSPGMPLSVGSEPLKFSVPMLPNSAAYTPGVYEVPLTFTAIVNGEEVTQVVEVTFTVTPAPAMTLDKDDIYVKAENDAHTSTETLVIGNEGEYKLSFSLRLDPTGIGEEAPDFGGGGIDPMSVETSELLRGNLSKGIRPMDATNAFDVPDDFQYRNAMYYPALPGTSAVYNYGANSLYDEFKAAVSYQAPAEGFNLSHVYMPVTIENAKNITILVEIVQGSDPAGETVLGRGQISIASQANPGSGSYFIIPMEKSVYLNPGEEFCVRVSYPAGIMYPAYLVAKEEAVVSGRYMGWTEAYGWFDVAELFEDQNGSLGYIISCLETQEGQPWIKLLNPESEGTVEVGSTAEIKLSVNAASARLEKANKAVLVIKTNDPAMPLVNFPIVLDKNGKPVIDGPSGVVYAKEGTTTNVVLTISDPDSDDYTVVFNDASGFGRLASVEASATDEATITANEDGSYVVAGATEPVKATVEITPDFGDASTGNAFIVTVTDSNEASADKVVDYEVEHVNRAPIAAENVNVTLVEGGTSEIVNYSELFSDPDGDELTYAFAMPENTVADAYTTEHGVIFVGKAVGTTNATVTATDPSGAATTLTLPVEVTEMSGIDGVDADSTTVTVMPNPVENDINAICRFDATDAVFTVYDASGKTVASKTTDVASGSTVVIPFGGMPAGFYVLGVDFGDRHLNVRLIKR